MSRVAVIGDVSGHLLELERLLGDLGVDVETGHVPGDLTVVQVGDLVHRGPGSAGVVALVERVRQANPDRWLQLVGNHETQYVRSPVFRWNETLDDATQSTLEDWWQSGWMTVAVALETTGQEVRAPGGQRIHVGSGGLLVTHAGLTAGRWNMLGSPLDASEAARAVNEDARRRSDDDWTGVWAPGVMLTRAPDMNAGCVWAAADSELAVSWVNWAGRAGALPDFHQAHGHARPAWVSRNGLAWSPVVRNIDRTRLGRKFDENTRVSRLIVMRGDMAGIDGLEGGMVLWGTDPGHTDKPKTPWGALELAQS